MITFLQKYSHKKRTYILLLLIVVYYFALPKKLFDKPTATVLESREGKLLGAKIAADMQWRFPASEKVPEKFKTCILQYEDAYFYKHPGFNPVSISKALLTNVKAGKVVRGGSTLTQQVIRLSRNKNRTYFEKFVELILSTRLELGYSKDKILNFYTANAPFGGNVVGLEAAAWRYFGQSADNLSWAENATLAVLPNAPGLIHPNKNRKKLKAKRDFLLHKLYKNQKIDSLTYVLALAEALPDKTYPIPQIAPHLLEKVNQEHRGKRIRSSISYTLQQRANKIVDQHYQELKNNHIYNMAAIVVAIPSRKILAYIGNTNTDKAHQKDVDIVTKARSTGSILKPFLFTAALDAGIFTPQTLIPDIPTQINGYKPENFNLSYYGAVPAGKAIAKSLNIPAVRMLKEYGVGAFYQDLNNLKLSHISKGADHYGLTLILGGAEASLWNLSRAYTTLGSSLNHYDQTQGKYYSNELQDLTYLKDEKIQFGALTEQYPLFDAGAIYTCFQTLLEVNRPEGDENWEFYTDAKKIAWKTGTSFGFRDAWAIGLNSNYLIGVWVGNADGEGRPGLTGIKVAAPVLFDLFGLVDDHTWFNTPYDELTEVNICSESGHIASDICPKTVKQLVPSKSIHTKMCPYHHLIHLDFNKQYQVNTSCEPIENIIHEAWFELPPAQAYFYKKHHPNYHTPPPFRHDCINNGKALMSFENNLSYEEIFLPLNEKELKNPLVIKVHHIKNDIPLYWYVDGNYIKTTQNINELSISLKKGLHIVKVVGKDGGEISKKINIL